MANGTFTPAAQITNQLSLGNALSRQALQGRQNASPLSPFANLLAGLGGGFVRGQAQGAQQQNQALRQQALSQLGEAGADPNVIARTLMGSGDPSLQTAGVNLLGRAPERAMAERRLKLAETTAARAGRETPLQAAQRLKIMAELGFDVGSPGTRAIPASAAAGGPRELPEATAFERKQLSKTLTPGEKAVDQKFAPDVVSFDAGGGFATVRGHLTTLQSVANRIDPRDPKTGKPTSGGEDVSGFFQGLIADTRFENLTPESKAARQQVQNAVISNLKQILGAQFTEREGTRILNLTFDPGIGSRENGRRVRNLINQMKTAARQKAAAVRHFKRRGTLRGFKGELPSFNFDPTRRTAPKAPRQPVGAVAAAAPQQPAQPVTQGSSFNTINDASASLAEGQIVRDTTTGGFLQKQGGRMVPVQQRNAAGFQFQGQPQQAAPIADPNANLQSRFLPPVPLTNIGR